MRSFDEPTCRHLLRQPLIFGVPFVGLLILSVGTVATQTVIYLFADGDIIKNSIGIAGSALSYGILRIFTLKAKLGWDQAILFQIERLASRKNGPLGAINERPSEIDLFSPDTVDDEGLLNSKQIIEDEFKQLAPDQLLIFKCEINDTGARLSNLIPIECCERLKKQILLELPNRLTGFKNPYLYSLYQIPVTTDPLWLFSSLKSIEGKFKVIASFRGVNQLAMKQKIESFRKLNSILNATDQMDTEISFEDASHVLRGLSRGDEGIVEMSLVIVSESPIKLDPHYFIQEKSLPLPLLSAFGLRPRFHRSHFVRFCTGSDLVPHIMDPYEDGVAILKTIRGKPLYFDPQDSRLDALHWLVSGATGTGKSFFVGLVLLRLLKAEGKISVLFIDHKRSFKRVVRSTQGEYLEPISFEELRSKADPFLLKLETPGIMTGIELSDLPLREKKESASLVLRKIAEFLSIRTSEHTLYIVMDECWKFLRDNPQGVEEAFREFRKFDTGVIAITQSLKDFISDEAGQSIIQNADITVLLRQKEDVTRFQDVLDLNEPEMSKVKQIKKKKGVFSECLIKTPFLSRFGRLYPTHEEHELLRTDNLRAERVALAKKTCRGMSQVPCSTEEGEQ